MIRDNLQEPFLKAPELNDVIRIGINGTTKKRDGHFVKEQNSAGVIKNATTVALDILMKDDPEPKEKSLALKKLADVVKEASFLFLDLSNTRKVFLTGGYDQPIKKMLEAAEPTSNLFGDNVGSNVTTTRDLENLNKKMKKKPLNNNNNNYNNQSRSKYNTQRNHPYQHNSHQNNRNLNWRSSFVNQKEVAQENYKERSYRSTTSRNNTTSRPARRSYTQSQPDTSRPTGKHCRTNKIFLSPLGITYCRSIYFKYCQGIQNPPHLYSNTT